MKKLSLISLLLIAGVLFIHAQTQRMVLYEGFSNASCPPCAAQNPTTNNLIAANPTKVVALKYQVNWPGVDPMNAQTQTWVAPRATYYSIDAVPSTRVDGGGTSISQSIINSRYAVPSPFFLTVNHTLNATADSAFVEVVVTAAQAYTGTSLVLQLAMVEKHISFASAPGANGETDFYHVMRRMFPNANGTSLPSTWTNAQSQTFNFAVAIPTYIYDLNQLAFVAFIQSNGNKSVLQSANNNPVPISLFPRIVNYNIPTVSCNQTLNLQVTVRNVGALDFNSFTVEYGIQGETIQVYNWTGTLAPGQQTVVTLPTFTFTTTTNPVAYIEVKNPNGSTNYPSQHAKVQQSLSLVANYTPAPIFQGFASAVFPPAGWIVSSDDVMTWTRASVGGFGNSPGGSARIAFFSIPIGKIDYLYVEPLNLTGVTDPILTFSLAHARFSANYTDHLQIEISNNCGQTWINIYDKSSANLATAPATTNSFTPTATQWRSDTVSLAQYSTYDEVFIRFKAISGYGNNLFLDDINITSTPTNIDENSLLNIVNVFPNPIADIFNVELEIIEASNITIQVLDIKGRLVFTESTCLISSGNHVMSIDASSWSAGLYQVKISTDVGSVTRKIMKD